MNFTTRRKYAMYDLLIKQPVAYLFCLRSPVFLVIGFFIVTQVFAQKDSKAKEILDRTSDTLSQSGGLLVEFTMNINDESNKIKQSFEGQMLLKGTKFFYDTPELAVYYDGKTQWVYQKNIEEVSISEPRQQDVQSLNPILVFEMYRTDCDYKYKGEKTDIKKRKVHEISLTPKNKKEDIKQIDLQIIPNDYIPVFFHIIYKNKQEFRIYIDKYQVKSDISDSLFEFDKSNYPQVEINDLR